MQHERQRNDSNGAVAAMVTAMAVAITAITLVAAAAKTMAATAMVGGRDNNQLKAAAKETVAAAKETAKATEMVPVTATKTTPMPTMGHQQQQ